MRPSRAARGGPVPLLAAAAFASALLFSCSADPEAAVLWTDRPEFAAYAEIFNTSQTRYKVEVFYRADPAGALLKEKVLPDLVVGSWLKSASTRSLFKPLDYFFEDLLLSEKSFYPAMLALGNIEGRQYLLPVSFNLPALVFSRENAHQVPAAFTIGMDQAEELARAYNQAKDGAFVRMGFSPRWDDEFLFVTAALHGAAFREGSPLAWDAAALDRAVAAIRAWTSRTNGDAAAEDDFAFKYLYVPAYKSAAGGRVLFAYMTSAQLFTAPEDARDDLDFRWVARGESIPVTEGSAFLGACKKWGSKPAADAFIRWFYREDAQQAMLDMARRQRGDATVFGIAGGFSAVRTVNEQIYPRFYAGLLGHVPPSDFLDPPGILPRDWLVLKKRVVLPYLHDRARAADDEKVPSLQERLADWQRKGSLR